MSGLLAIGALAAALLAWQRQPGDADQAPPAQAALPTPPSLPAPPQPRPPAQAFAPIADEPPLNLQVERLLASRDPEDAYRAYWLVADCAAFNRDHDRIIFDQPDLKHWAADALPGFRAMTADEKRHDARLCGTLTERERQSRLDYLAFAARAGVMGAAVTFATEGPFGDPSALETRPGDPLVQAWKATASAQLTRAAESGTDPNALQYLAGEYASGSELTEKNPLLAYRYLLALNLIDAALAGPGDPAARSLAGQREGLEGMVQDFSPEQRAAEEAAARRIADLARARRARPAG
jgi:hypothetical protein